MKKNKPYKHEETEIEDASGINVEKIFDTVCNKYNQDEFVDNGKLITTKLAEFLEKNFNKREIAVFGALVFVTHTNHMAAEKELSEQIVKVLMTSSPGEA